MALVVGVEQAEQRVVRGPSGIGVDRLESEGEGASGAVERRSDIDEEADPVGLNRHYRLVMVETGRDVNTLAGEGDTGQLEGVEVEVRVRACR